MVVACAAVSMAAPFNSLGAGFEDNARGCDTLDRRWRPLPRVPLPVPGLVPTSRPPDSPHPLHRVSQVGPLPFVTIKELFTWA